MRHTLRRSFLIVPAVVALGVLVTGCSSPAPARPTTPSASSAAPTSATPTAPPTFDPGASADEAKVFFDTVNAATVAADADARGRAFIDGLAAAGFDKAAMELTADQTTIGNAADSIQFSVRWGDTCLIGQNGSAVDGYHSTLAPVLATAKCLIGSTRPIDW